MQTFVAAKLKEAGVLDIMTKQIRQSLDGGPDSNHAFTVPFADWDDGECWGPLAFVVERHGAERPRHRTNQSGAARADTTADKLELERSFCNLRSDQWGIWDRRDETNFRM